MTNYEKICAYINAGHYAVTEDEEKVVRVFTLIKSNGSVRYGRGGTLQRALDDTGGLGSNKDRVNDLPLTRIYPLPRPIPKYQKGDKVVVLENIKEVEIGNKFTAGEICEVTGLATLGGGVGIENQSGVSWYVLPHCVAPYFDDEAEEMTVEQICKALGKNIKIVK